MRCMNVASKLESVQAFGGICILFIVTNFLQYIHSTLLQLAKFFEAAMSANSSTKPGRAGNSFGLDYLMPSLKLLGHGVLK